MVRRGFTEEFCHLFATNATSQEQDYVDPVEVSISWAWIGSLFDRAAMTSAFLIANGVSMVSSSERHCKPKLWKISMIRAFHGIEFPGAICGRISEDIRFNYNMTTPLIYPKDFF